MSSIELAKAPTGFLSVEPHTLRIMTPLWIADYVSVQKREFQKRFPKSKTHEGESFAVLMRRVYGMSKSEVSRCVRRATIKPAIRKLIAETRFLSTPKELDALSRLPAAKQRDAVMMVVMGGSGAPVTLTEAAIILNGGQLPVGLRKDGKDRAMERAIDIYGEEAEPESLDITQPHAPLLAFGRKVDLLCLHEAENGRVVALAQEKFARDPEIDAARLRKFCVGVFGRTVRAPMPSEMAFWRLRPSRLGQNSDPDPLALLMEAYAGRLARGTMLPFAKARIKEKPSLTIAEVRAVCVQRYGERVKMSMPSESAFADLLTNFRAGK